MQLSHILQCTIFCNRNLYVCTFLIQSGALWDICLIYCGICEMGQLYPTIFHVCNLDVIFLPSLIPMLVWLISVSKGDPCSLRAHHDDVINWKHFSRYWLFVRGIYRSPVNSPHIFFGLRLNKRLSKQSWGWWFETLSHPLWRHCNDTRNFVKFMFLLRVNRKG